MRPKTLILLGVFCAFLGRCLCFGQGFDFGHYHMLSNAPLGGSNYEYVLRVNVTNRAADALAVSAQVFSTHTNTTVISGLVNFGNLAFGESAASTNTFKVRQLGTGIFNPSPLQWFVSVQSMPLSVFVTTPAGTMLTNGTNVVVSGSVGPAVEGVILGRTNVPLAGGNFSAVIPIEEGRNIITVVATNAFGGAGAANVTVHRDTTAPFLSIDTPTNGTTVATRQITVSGQINDAVPGTVNPEQATVTVNGVTAALLNRSYAASDVLLAPGTNQIVVVGRDRAGNESQKGIEVIFREPVSQKRLVALAGEGQTGVVGTNLPDSLLVELVDRDGVVQTNQPVTFSLTRSDGTLLAPPDSGRSLTVQTDDKGRASVLFRIGTRAGSGNNQVAVTSPGVSAPLTFSAHGTGGAPARVSALIPETQVGEAGKPLAQPWTALITDEEGNPVAGAPVAFMLMQGSGSFGGQMMITTNTDGDGRASAVLTLGSEAGVNNHVVFAMVPGVTNSSATYIASAQTPQAAPNTRVVGLVLDNANRPMSNVLCIIYRTFLAAVTDANGRFVISNAPVGAIRLLVDARERGYPGDWHALEFDLVTVAGRDNSVDRPIYMLPLDSTNAVMGGGPQDVQLRLKGIPGATMTIFANSVRNTAGNPITNAVTWTEVNQERVPMAPPKGSQFSLAWTVQPPGLRFDPPARICIPNAGMSPGQMLEMFGFDHDLGAFVSLGTGTVTPDGSQVCSDPGFGVTKSGWGGFIPPRPPCTAACRGPANSPCFDYITHPGSGLCDCARYEERPKMLVSNVVPQVNGKKEAFGGTNTMFNFTVTAQHPDCASVTYNWDFDDGETSTTQNPTHQFKGYRTYHPKVTVACSSCPQSKVTDQVTVGITALNLIVHKPKRVDLSEPEVPYDTKLSIGAQTFENLDNDDGGTAFDLNKDTVVGGDDELVKVRIQLPGAVDPDGTVQFEISEGAANVRLWKLDTKTLEFSPSEPLDIADFTEVGGAKEYTLYVEGIEAHTAQRGTKLKARLFDSGHHLVSEDQAAITVLGLVGLSWEGKKNSVLNLSWFDDGVNHPLDLDRNWPAASLAGLPPAVRVFPDARLASPLGDLGPVRDKVNVKARLSVAPVEPIQFQFRSFDVDDPTADQDAVDNDKTGAIADDNRGSSPAQAGKLVGSDGNGVLAVTFDAGEAEKTFEFQTTMQPGDNFRIAGACDSAFISTLVNDDSAPYCYLFNDAKQQIYDSRITQGTASERQILKSDKYVSPTLTVWRFVHVEVDAMGPPTTNFVAGVITNVTSTRVLLLDSVADESVDLESDPVGNGRFENGTLRIAGTHTITGLNGNGSNYFSRAAGFNLATVPLPFEAIGFFGGHEIPLAGTVTSYEGVNNVFRSLNLVFSQGSMEFIEPGESEIRIGGGPWMQIEVKTLAAVLVDELRIPYVAHDDDMTNAPGLPDTSKLVETFAPGYVLPLVDLGASSTDLPFIPNMESGDAAGVSVGWAFDWIAYEASTTFWTVYIRNSWQETRDADDDPNGEGATFGTVDTIGGRGANIYVEVIRAGEGFVPNPAQGLAIAYTVAHEVGHLFGGLHNDGCPGGPGTPGCPAAGLMAQTSVRTLPNFNDITLNKIRSVAHP